MLYLSELKDKNDSFIFVGDDKRHYQKNADGTVGNIGIHKCEGKFHMGSNVGKMELLFPITSEEFIVYYLKSSTQNNL